MGKGELMHKGETPRRVNQVTDPGAVEAAIVKCEELGQKKFLKVYGFRDSAKFPLMYKGIKYASKAIAAVAFGIQHQTEPLRAAKDSEIHGGIKPHEAGGVLERLGFEIIKP
jgi:hypothetical protein